MCRCCSEECSRISLNSWMRWISIMSSSLYTLSTTGLPVSRHVHCTAAAHTHKAGGQEGATCAGHHSSTSIWMLGHVEERGTCGLTYQEYIAGVACAQLLQGRVVHNRPGSAPHVCRQEGGHGQQPCRRAPVFTVWHVIAYNHGGADAARAEARCLKKRGRGP